MNTVKRLQENFWRRLNDPGQLGRLFDYLPDTYFYAKDAGGRFVMVNEAFARMYGSRSTEAMIGKTDHDFAPRDLADAYVAEDRRVMQSGRPIVHQAWLVPNYQGDIKWYLSSKIPLFGRHGKVIGIAGAMRDVEAAGLFLKPYHEMERATSHVLAHYAEKIEMPHLAQLAHLSLSQFDRRFKRLFQATPQQFVLRVRIHAACRRLMITGDSAAQIAQQTGFYDQSYFTRQFRRHMGLTPAAYRRKYRGASASPSTPSEEPLPAMPLRRAAHSKRT